MESIVKHSPAAELVSTFLAGRTPTTLRAYRGDLASFAAHLQVEDAQHAAEVVLSAGHGPANGIVLRYQASLLDAGLAPATVNRRVAAVRSLVKLARMLGLVDWTLDVQDVQSTPLRDCRGPGRDGVASMLAIADVREGALLHLLFDLAMRRSEVAGLQKEDVDLQAKRVAIRGKGRLELEWRTLPESTCAALSAWMVVRGDHAGSLLGWSDDSIYSVVGRLGQKALGKHVRPHGLRHAAITAVLDANGGDVRAAAQFSRHKDLRTLVRYDDSRQDLAGAMASLVALE